MKGFPICRWTLCLGLCLPGAWLTTAHAAVLIDDFSQGPLKIQATNHAGLNVLQNGLGSSAIGGSRLVHVGSLQVGTLTVETNISRFNYFANVGLGYFTLDWGDSAQLFNLATAGNNAF